MKRTFMRLALAAGVIATGCGGSGIPASQTTTAVEGTWWACVTVSGVDTRKMLTLSEGNLSMATATFPTTNGTCSVQVTSAVGVQTTYSLTADVTARLGMGTVTAQQLTINLGPTPVYTIVYVNAGVTPALLYLGDLSATSGFDGTAPAKRPTVLDAAWVYQKQ